MDKSMLKGMLLGGAAVMAVSAGGVVGYKALNKPATTEAPVEVAAAAVVKAPEAPPKPTFAEVLLVKEITETIKTPREQCEDVQVQKQAPVKDENRVAGTVTGAVIGGLLGNQIGGGKGKTVATVAGVAAGGYAGNKVQQNMQQKDMVTTTERRCTTVEDVSKKTVGFDVTYRLEDKEGIVRMDHNPGKQIPVKDGQLVLTSAKSTSAASGAAKEPAPK